MTTLASSRLRRLARGEEAARPAGGAAAPAADPELESCDLCGTPLPGEHRHLVDTEKRELRCACRACALLFDKRGAGAGHLRLVPDRRLRLEGFALTDEAWADLRVPVDMAFFFRSSAAGRVMAFYPSPMGATESLLELEAWEGMERENPVLRSMEDDVEALLVNRARGARGHWIVPIDECYALVGVIRTRWRGFTGGTEVWTEIGRFFEELDRRAVTAKEDTWE